MLQNARDDFLYLREAGAEKRVIPTLLMFTWYPGRPRMVLPRALRGNFHEGIECLKAA